MKRMVRKYRFSKFKRITDGLMFGLISVIALILCLTDLSDHQASVIEIIFPFCIAILSMLLGFKAMFHENQITKQ